MSNIWEIIIFYKLKRNPPTKIKLDSSHKQCKNCTSGKILLHFKIQIDLQIFIVIKRNHLKNKKKNIADDYRILN